MAKVPRERVIEVRRTARFFEAGGAAGETEQLWYVLHGYGELASAVAARVAFLATPARRVVVPEALSRFYRAGTDGESGASWMTREAREAEIEDYVGFLDAVHARILAVVAGSARLPQVTLIGFSQGTATACRWVAFGNVRFERLILWGGAVPPDVDVEGDRDDFVGLAYVVGDADPYVTPARIAEERARIEAAGLPFHLTRFAGGHRLDDDVLRDLALP
jgi:predicted esterase